MRAALLLAAALALAACGEADQVMVYDEGDAERASWEKQMRNRQLSQGENQRIYH